MSHVSSQHSGAKSVYDTFLVIFRVCGSTINVWPRLASDNQSAPSSQPSSSKNESQWFNISCHNVGGASCDSSAASDIRAVVFKDKLPAHDITSDDVEGASFLAQPSSGLRIGPKDLATFMTRTLSTQPASYSIEIGSPTQCTSTIAGGGGQPAATVADAAGSYEKLGVAYLYLDPEFSTQGVQKTPLVSPASSRPIGQVQVEYLIVTNPIAYGLQLVRPDWLNILGMEAGHRGSGAGRRKDLPTELLENTIASFNYAHRHGADFCELDVVISADGVPVVYHDFDVDAVTAHQSTDRLGKFRVHVNEFTVEQLRNFRLLSLHDEEGCLYTLRVNNRAEDNRPFPTLAEVFQKVDPTCGLNIEIKWPQMLSNGKMEARKCREINDFVERIIDVAHRFAGDRRVVLESFDADLVILLRLKQNRFPVFFLSQGLTNLYDHYMDIRARSLEIGIQFAQAFNFAGIDIILEYYLSMGKSLVELIKKHELVARAWGNIGDDMNAISQLRQLGLQCITYDRIDLVKCKKYPQQLQEITSHHQVK